MFTAADICVHIFSWKKVTGNAKALFRAIAPHFPNTTFINCDETAPVTEEDIAPHTLQRDDSYYYGGQFETALKNTPPGKILACVVGDVNPAANWEQIAENAVKALNTGRVGVYAPNVYYTWHTARGNALWDELYEVPNTDCTCWFIHPTVYGILREIPVFAASNLGWGIDTICMKETARQRLLVARDYAVKVEQPQGTNYSTQAAHEQMSRILGLYAIVLSRSHVTA
jgi:hypothetical protein